MQDASQAEEPKRLGRRSFLAASAAVAGGAALTVAGGGPAAAESTVPQALSGNNLGPAARGREQAVASRP